MGGPTEQEVIIQIYKDAKKFTAEGKKEPNLVQGEPLNKSSSNV